MATDYLDFHVQLQGVANSLGEELVSVLSAEDKKLLAYLQKELAEVRKLMLAKEYSPAFMRRLQKIRTGIETLRDKAVKEMTEVIQGTAGRVADLQAKEAGDEIFDAWQEKKEKAVKKEKSLRQKYLRPELTQDEIDNIVDNQFINGYTMEQLVTNCFGAADRNRIFQAVQRGIVEGTTLAGIMKAVKENALDSSRADARMVARTVINGVANNTRMAMYRQNADVIDGIKFLATLDSRTCPVCGVMDGKVWATDKLNEVPSLPLHPSCRCVLIPHIDIGEEYEGERAAEAVNFTKLAEEEHNANPKATKKWDELSYTTRQKLRNKQVRGYEAAHGRGSSYRQISTGKQVNGSRTFEDYLKGQPAEFQRQYLGATRAKLFAEGKLTLDQMVNPDKGYFRSVKDLEKLTAGIAKANAKSELSEASDLAPPTIRWNDIFTKDTIDTHDDVDGYLYGIDDENYRNIRERVWNLEKELAIKIEGNASKNDIEIIKNTIQKERRTLDRLERELFHQFIAPTSGDKVKEVLYNVEQITDAKGKPIKSEYTKLPIKDGSSFVARIIDSHNITVDAPSPKFVSKNIRAEYNVESNVLDVGRRAGVDQLSAHELGHWVERHNTVISKQCSEWYNDITKDGGKPRSLKADFPKGEYNDDEMYIPSKIAMPEYALKIGNGYTELFSVGMEHLYKNPIQFSKQYPQYFDFILKTIKLAGKK